jgi:L-rhamnose mutarotase
MFETQCKKNDSNMQRVAFKMILNEGCADEYKRRHTELWPELQRLLKDTGIAGYSIFLDDETYTLFGVLSIADEALLNALPHQPVMQRWWAYMKDIMHTNEDDSPVSIPLREVFYLP